MEKVKVRCIKLHDGFTVGKIYDFPHPIDDNGEERDQIITYSCWLDVFEKIETKKEMKEEYDLSTTITRAVKNDDPSIIMKETGKSVEEVCSWVEDKGCMFLCGSECNCRGLSCYNDWCPFNGSCLSKESAIKWLKGEIDKHGNPKNKKEEPKDIKPIPRKPLSDYDAVHVDSQEKWNFVSEKLGYHWNAPDSKWITNGKNTCINIRGCKFGVTYKSILSFEEWLDLTGYYLDWMLSKYRKQFLEDQKTVLGYNIHAAHIPNFDEEYELTNDNSNNFESSKKDSTFVSWEAESDDYVEYKALPVQHCSMVEFLTNEE